MSKKPREEECILMERRECAAMVQDLAKAVTRQATITEERVLPTLEKIDAALLAGAAEMKDHHTRLTVVEERQKTARTWSVRGWGIVAVLFAGFVLAIFRDHLGK